MIVDTSALIAVLFGEDHELEIVAAIDAAVRPSIGTPSLLEAEMVAGTRGGVGGARTPTRLAEQMGLTEVPFDSGHRMAAVSAFLTYGKGRHPARLNLGDCMTYAIAKVAGEPLLCVGDDFAQTDLELVPLD